MADDQGFSLLEPFRTFAIPLADWADGIKTWAIQNRDTFQTIREPLDFLINGIEGMLQAVPP
jgi:glycine betaine/proline transport system permease protein